MTLGYLLLTAAATAALTPNNVASPRPHWRPRLSSPTALLAPSSRHEDSDLAPFAARWKRLPAITSTILLGGARPTFAAAAKTAVPFALLGMGSSALFPIQNLSLLSWSLLLFLPRWRWTSVLALVAPVIHSVLYALLLVHAVRHPVPGLAMSFSSLEGIMPGFALPDGAFAGWLHYCIFDPLVGLGIVLDADQQRIPHLLCVPCLVMTLFAGPVGFLSYLAIRTATLLLRKQGVLRPGAKRLMRPRMNRAATQRTAAPRGGGGGGGGSGSAGEATKDVDAMQQQREANTAKVMDVLFTEPTAFTVGEEEGSEEPGRKPVDVEKAIDALWSSGPSFDDK